MKLLKIQQELLKAQLKNWPNEAPDRAAWCDFDEEHVFVTIDGFVAWVIPKQALLVKLDKIRTTTLSTKSFRDVADSQSNRLTPTGLYVREGTTQKYERDDGKAVHIVTKSLAWFDNPKLYSTGPFQPVVVTEWTQNGEEQVVGVVMPIKL